MGIKETPQVVQVITVPKNRRTSKPKVRTGCLTCKKRRLKCDENKPSCNRCVKGGHICEGYRKPNLGHAAPRELAPAPVSIPSIEARALEFFFIKTAPQLAGYFETGFFRRSVLQLSFSEPLIRQAISAIGIAHSQTSLGSKVLGSDQTHTHAHIQLYNKSIRATIDKACTGSTGSADTTCLIAVANVLFTCFEVIQGNIPTAAAHVQSGLRLFHEWRDANGGPPGPWGRKYSSPNTQFMETEIAPLLALFNTNSVDCGGGGRAKLVLSSGDGKSGPFGPEDFQSLAEARVGLIDMIPYAVHFSTDEMHENERMENTQDPALVLSRRVKWLLELWKTKFKSLLLRESAGWNKRKQRMIDMITVIRLSTEFGIRSFSAESECQWDLFREEYVEVIRVIDAIVSDKDRFPDNISRALSLDAGMIFPLHTAAWKCRWPKLRRQGLALLRRIPRREWLFEASHYHAIFSRIMEIEESEWRMELGIEPDDDWLPPEHVRVTDWVVNKTSRVTQGISSEYEITFFNRPRGCGGPLNSRTEIIQLESSQNAVSVIPTNMISRHKRQT